MPTTAAHECENTSLTLKVQPTMHSAFHCTDSMRCDAGAFDILANFENAAVAAHDEDTMIFAFQNEEQHHDQSQHFCARSGTTSL